MIHCTDAEHLLLKHMEGTITQAERQQLHSHTANCPACLEYYLAYDEAMEYAASPVVSWQLAPDHFTAGVMAKVASTPEKAVAKGHSMLRYIIGGGSVAIGIILYLAIAFDLPDMAFQVADLFHTGWTGLNARIDGLAVSLQNPTFAIDGHLASAALLFSLIASVVLVALQNNKESTPA